MPTNPIVLRKLYESAVGRDAQGRENEGGRYRFVTTVRHWLGLCDEDGNDHRDKNGNRTVKLTESKFTAEDFNMQEMALSMLGVNTYQQYMNPDNRNSLAGLPAYKSHIAFQHPNDPIALFENVGVGVDPSAFADISAWGATTAGLIERKILEQFQNPMYIGDELLPTESTRIGEAQKIIGTSRALPQPTSGAGGPAGSGSIAAVQRLPNQPHARTTILERYVTTGKSREFGMGIDITKEAAWFDLTGQLLPSAGNIGWLLGYEKEIQQIDAFIGVSTQSGGLFQFVYKGTAQNFYTTTPITPTGAPYSLGYTSQIAANGPLVDYTNLQTSWTTYLRNTDPETGTRINDMPDTVLVNPANVAAGMLTIDPGQVQRREAQGATQATAVQLLITEGTNPAKMFGARNFMWSPLVEQRCTDATGLNLSQTNANAYWWHFTKGKPFKWFQLWPLTIQMANPTNYDSLDRGIIQSTFADWRGYPVAVSPWNAIRNTN